MPSRPLLCLCTCCSFYLECSSLSSSPGQFISKHRPGVRSSENPSLTPPTPLYPLLAWQSHTHWNCFFLPVSLIYQTVASQGQGLGVHHLFMSGIYLQGLHTAGRECSLLGWTNEGINELALSFKARIWFWVTMTPRHISWPECERVSLYNQSENIQKHGIHFKTYWELHSPLWKSCQKATPLGKNRMANVDKGFTKPFRKSPSPWLIV